MSGIYAKGFDAISIIPTFVLTPLTYLGGVFYSVDMLPSFWQKVSLFTRSSTWWMVSRYGFLGIGDISIVWNISVLVGACLLALGATMWLVRTGQGLRGIG